MNCSLNSITKHCKASIATCLDRSSLKLLVDNLKDTSYLLVNQKREWYCFQLYPFKIYVQVNVVLFNEKVFYWKVLFKSGRTWSYNPRCRKPLPNPLIRPQSPCYRKTDLGFCQLLLTLDHRAAVIMHPGLLKGVFTPFFV